ncbi:MAG: hypothetical protein IJF32_04040 [Oscillospiraceae bacterium]|nr:hypothetical protein [Oscillospiraceae bacterium]
MKKLNKKIAKALEKFEFQYGEVQKQGIDYYIELQQYTPEGEDWNTTIWFNGTAEGFIDSLASLVEDFDVDEEASIWIDHRGKNGVPNSIVALVHDAEWKLETLEQLLKYLEGGEGDE